MRSPMGPSPMAGAGGLPISTGGFAGPMPGLASIMASLPGSSAPMPGGTVAPAAPVSTPAGPMVSVGPGTIPAGTAPAAPGASPTGPVIAPGSTGDPLVDALVQERKSLESRGAGLQNLQTGGIGGLIAGGLMHWKQAKDMEALKGKEGTRRAERKAETLQKQQAIADILHTQGGYDPKLLEAMTPEQRQAELVKLVEKKPGSADRKIVQLADGRKYFLNPDGTSELVRPELELPAEAPARLKEGRNMVSPDGEVRAVTTQAQADDLTTKGWTFAPETSLEASVKGKEQTKVIGLADSAAKFAEIRETVKPEYLTIPGKIRLTTLDLQEKAGATLSKESRKELSDFSTWKRSSYDAMNRYIKEITGAQMSEKEADRIRKAIPDPSRDGPTEFMSKLEGAQAEIDATIRRRQYFLDQGITVPTEQDFIANPLSRFKSDTEEVVDFAADLGPGAGTGLTPEESSELTQLQQEIDRLEQLERGS